MDQAQLLALGQDLLLLISPLVAQGAIQKLGEDTTDRVTLLAQRAWGALQQRFTGMPKAEAALTLYEDEPSDPGMQQRIAQQIAACFADHQDAITELEEIVHELRAATGAPPAQRTHTQNISGNAQVGVAVSGDVHGGISHVQQSGGINFGSGNTIGTIGDVVAGDKIGGDKVLGDKIMNYGAPKPADTGPEHLRLLIDQHIRRLRVLESQAAVYGYNARPEVQNEIEDIRAELARLQALRDA
jgi:hypothetical protein